jgi:hypothetical protein
MLAVRWTRCAERQWCELAKVNVAAVQSSGTFVVWLGGERPRTVRVGYGPIALSVRAQRHDARVLGYRKHGTLYVTWAVLPDYESKAATIYLTRMMRPLLADPLPEVGEIEVNLPWTSKIVAPR